MRPKSFMSASGPKESAQAKEAVWIKKFITELAMLGAIPMKRFGQTEEVAEVAAFLAQQEYMTGQVIAIDGGMTMQ